MRGLELFAGAGGRGIGVSRAGFNPAAVVELDRYCCDAIREDRERGLDPLVHWPLFQGDIRDFDFRSVESHVDLIIRRTALPALFDRRSCTGGPLDDRDMFPQAECKVRRTTGPVGLSLLENVWKSDEACVLRLLANISGSSSPTPSTRGGSPRVGWTISDASSGMTPGTGSTTSPIAWRRRVLNTADFGVPQRRDRVFIVGFRADLGIDWSYPEAYPFAGSASLFTSGKFGRVLGPPSSAPAPWGCRTRRDANATMKPADEASRRTPWRTVRDASSGLADAGTRTRKRAQP